MVNIETYIKAIELKNQGLSTKNISNETGVCKNTLSNWFIGKGTLKYEKLINGDFVGVKIPDSIMVSPIEYLKMCSSISNDKELFMMYSYMLGLYLGDGHIFKFERTKCLSITLDSKYINLNEDVINSFMLLFSDVRVFTQKYNAIDVRHYDCNLGLLFPQDGDGLKCDRVILIEEWQSEILDPVELLRGLIMSDGSYYMRKSTQQYEYNFSNCSLDIINIVCKCLDILEIKYGLRSLPSKNENHHDGYKITITAKDSVTKLHYYIGDKVNIRNRNDVDFEGYYCDFNNVKSFRSERNKNRVINKI